MRVRVELFPGCAPEVDAGAEGWPREARLRAAVVIDVLRATSTLTAALASGAARVIPVARPDEAFALKRAHPDALTCGERGGLKVPGFDLGNSPEEYTTPAVEGRTLLFASTNGSLALLACAGSGRRVLGAFVNAAAVVEALAAERFVTLLCAGKEGRFSLEDAACAGFIAAALAARGATMDGARARLVLALAPRDAAGVRALVQGCSHGRYLRALGGPFARDVEFCGSVDRVARAFEI